MINQQSCIFLLFLFSVPLSDKSLLFVFLFCPAVRTTCTVRASLLAILRYSRRSRQKSMKTIPSARTSRNRARVKSRTKTTWSQPGWNRRYTRGARDARLARGGIPLDIFRAIQNLVDCTKKAERNSGHVFSPSSSTARVSAAQPRLRLRRLRAQMLPMHDPLMFVPKVWFSSCSTATAPTVQWLCGLSYFENSSKLIGGFAVVN